MTWIVTNKETGEFLKLTDKGEAKWTDDAKEAVEFVHERDALAMLYGLKDGSIVEGV